MMKELTVLEAKRYGIYSCRAGATLLDVSRRLVEEDISCLVVVDEEGYLAGLISHTDLVRAGMEEDAWESEPVSRYMSRQVVTVTEDATVERVGELLLDHCIHRVVVVREEGEERRLPVAVVSSSDLVYHMVKMQKEGLQGLSTE